MWCLGEKYGTNPGYDEIGIFGPQQIEQKKEMKIQFEILNASISVSTNIVFWLQKQSYDWNIFAKNEQTEFHQNKWKMLKELEHLNKQSNI